MVVVWGYRNYVKSSDLDKHECTRNCKRIVTTLVPEGNDLNIVCINRNKSLNVLLNTKLANGRTNSAIFFTTFFNAIVEGSNGIKIGTLRSKSENFQKMYL